MNTNRFTISVFIIMVLITACVCGCLSNNTGTQGTGTPTVQATPTTTHTTTPDFVPAKEWYSIAENNATKWQADAQLYDVFGMNYNKSGVKAEYKNRTVDGKAYYWTYDFVSVPANKRYTVKVESGEITFASETILDPSSPANERYRSLFTDLYPVSNWKIDSPDAAVKANEMYRQKYGKDPSGIVTAYMLYNKKDAITDKNIIYWEINYNASTDTPAELKYTVNIDAITGDVI
jgi:hypothetical protein